MAAALVDDYANVPLTMKKAAADKRTMELSKLLNLAHSEEEGKAQEAAFRLWEFLNNLSDEERIDLTSQISVSGPLAHILAKFLDSHNRNLLLYSSRCTKTMMMDDDSRQALCKSGIGQAVCARLVNHGSETCPEVKVELFASIQNMLFDPTTAGMVAAAGGLRAVGDGIASVFEDVEKGTDLELRTVVLACAANAFSYCDKTLASSIHEMRSWVELLMHGLGRMRLPQDAVDIEYTVAALANAARDPGLLHALRAANGAECLERCRHGESKVSEAANVALSRLQYTASTDKEKVWRFKWGGIRSTSRMNSQQVMGMLAFLLATTTIAGFAIWLLLYVGHHGQYF